MHILLVHVAIQMKMGLSLSHIRQVIAGLSSKSILVATHVNCSWLDWPHEGLAAFQFCMEILLYLLELSCVLIILPSRIVEKDVLHISWGSSSMSAQHGECFLVL
jgi:hypothetical protein